MGKQKHLTGRVIWGQSKRWRIETAVFIFVQANFSCSLFSAEVPGSLSSAELPSLCSSLAHSGFCEQGWKPPELQRWDLQAATWACHLLQMSLPDGWADAAWNKETIIFAPGWVL